MFQKILIANRGEIACRIIKTARRLGVQCVAIYSVADKDNPHVLMADEAYCVGEAAVKDSYLNIQAIIDAARTSGAQAIHPGYGFLSENVLFAQACMDAGITFIGPSIFALETMGSKQLSKQLLEKTDVPLTPGYHGDEQTDEVLLNHAKAIGFPVLLKAALGGGGKGMRAVFNEDMFKQALEGARREALAFFANDTMMIEKLIENPRHIEIQIMADHHGNTVHLFERDCSIQRRHQKIIEEAPAAGLSTSLREQLATAAITVAKKINYIGAGTIEFLVSNEQFYFMEMNTRLQVEHPVTELITGIDLVEWQLLIASNQKLPLLQSQIQPHGYAIECRIYAEDPRQDFLPSIGDIQFLQEPKGIGIRIDSGIQQNSKISKYYDPMLAKLIVHGADRTQALQRLLAALKTYYIGGIKTNLAFLEAIITHPQFMSAPYTTDFLSKETIPLPVTDKPFIAIIAACFDYIQAQAHLNTLEKDTFAWQMHQQTQWKMTYVIQHEHLDVIVMAHDLNKVTLKLNENTYTFTIRYEGNLLLISDGQKIQRAIVHTNQDKLTIYLTNEPIEVSRFTWESNQNKTQDHQLTSPMPSTIVAILKKVGDSIKKGDGLIVLEAMKMEHTIYAPHDGTITEILYDLGAQVPEDAQLIILDHGISA